MSLRRYEELLTAAEIAYGEGRYEASLAAAAEAEEVARQSGRQDLVDRASCNRCPALIELDRLGEHIPELRRILLRASEPRTRWMAAYYAAVGFDIDREHEQARFYAKRAFDLVEEVGDPAVVGASANLLGKLALASSDFVEAEVAYRRSLDTYVHLDGYNQVMAAQVKSNLGYALLCLERLDEGVAFCEAARRAMEQLGAHRLVHDAYQYLCYGHLLRDDVDAARRYGERGLELALEAGDRLVVKNLMFLLAEVAVRSGDRFRARRYLHELAQYYPELDISDEIIDLLMATDFTRAVNLRGS